MDTLPAHPIPEELAALTLHVGLNEPRRGEIPLLVASLAKETAKSEKIMWDKLIDQDVYVTRELTLASPVEHFKSLNMMLDDPVKYVGAANNALTGANLLGQIAGAFVSMTELAAHALSDLAITRDIQAMTKRELESLKMDLESPDKAGNKPETEPLGEATRPPRRNPPKGEKSKEPPVTPTPAANKTPRTGEGSLKTATGEKDEFAIVRKRPGRRERAERKQAGTLSTVAAKTISVKAKKSSKTCRNWTKGVCKFGKQCWFNHPAPAGPFTGIGSDQNIIAQLLAQLISAKAPKQQAKKQAAPSRKSRTLCRQWEERKQCQFGKRCHFTHRRSDRESLFAEEEVVMPPKRAASQETAKGLGIKLPTLLRAPTFGVPKS